MKVILNGELADLNEMHSLLFERGYNYGDGLFETIVIRNGNIKYLDYHMERLQNGMQLLSMEGGDITKRAVEQSIDILLKEVGIKDECRVKLLVWRQVGGLYTPLNNDANILFTAGALNARQPMLKTCGIAESIRLSYSALSSLKTCSALPYVLAGIEKKSRNLDEILILDGQNHLAECSSSNLFWLKNGNIYTPSLESGCIAGVMRRHILHQARQSGIEIQEVLENPETLLTADQVFCCNVTGVYLFEKFEQTRFDTKLNPQIEKWLAI